VITFVNCEFICADNPLAVTPLALTNDRQFKQNGGTIAVQKRLFALNLPMHVEYRRRMSTPSDSHKPLKTGMFPNKIKQEYLIVT
jgi:hypothetical protein